MQPTVSKKFSRQFQYLCFYSLLRLAYKYLSLLEKINWNIIGGMKPLGK